MTTEEIDIRHEVRVLIEAALNRNLTFTAKTVTETVIAKHEPTIHGTGKNWFLVCGNAHVRKLVNDALGEYEGHPGKTPDQLLLPGFDYLQKAYMVERKGERTGVPTHLCTDEELRAKALYLETMAAGCLAHATEIRNYLRDRKKDSAQNN